MHQKAIFELQGGLTLAQHAYKVFVEDMKRLAPPGTTIAWEDSFNGKPKIFVGTIESYCEDYSAWVRVEPSGALNSIPLGHLVPKLTAYSG